VINGSVTSRPESTQRRVVICSAHHYSSAMQVSAHHYARLFSKDGWSVLFLATPVTPFHAIAAPRSRDHRSRLAAWWRRGRLDGATGIIQYMPMTVLPLSSVVGLRFSWVLRDWWRFTVPPLAKELRSLGFFRPDLAIVDSVLGTFMLDVLAPATSVYRMTDYNAGFASSTSQLSKLEAELAKQVDIIAVTASELEPVARGLASGKTFVHMPHGVDFGHFADPGPAPPELRELPRPIAIYVGSLREWFDFDLVSELATQLPQVSFVLVGPDRPARGKLADRANLHLLGERPYRDVPGYLAAADVGIIPFDRRRYARLVDHINPLKLYEYMAAGLPVVATECAVLRRLASPALLCAEPAQFANRLLEALGSAGVLAAAGQRFALEHSWEESYRALLAAVETSQRT
jgi:glycosyltransferase involved in cell wall biosynthesis